MKKHLKHELPAALAIFVVCVGFMLLDDKDLVRLTALVGLVTMFWDRMQKEE